MPLAVRGLKELTRTFNQAPADTKKAYRSELRTLGEPTRLEAEQLASSTIRRVGPKWSRMRTGITTSLVYVAPRQRGVKGRGSDRLRRPKFGTLLMERAMEPALARNQPRIEHEFETMLDRLVTGWDHG